MGIYCIFEGRVRSPQTTSWAAHLAILWSTLILFIATVARAGLLPILSNSTLRNCKNTVKFLNIIENTCKQNYKDGKGITLCPFAGS